MKDELETKLKQILKPKSSGARSELDMIPPAPPQNKSQAFDAGGRERRLERRPPARFSSLSNTKKHINANEPKHESETACLLRPLRCLLSMSQREGCIIMPKMWLQTAAEIAGNRAHFPANQEMLQTLLKQLEVRAVQSAPEH